MTRRYPHALQSIRKLNCWGFLGVFSFGVCSVIVLRATYSFTFSNDSGHAASVPQAEQPQLVTVETQEIQIPADYGYTPTTTLVSDLQQGGHIIFFRHAATDRSQKDSDIRDLSNCSTQRNLSSTGREDARRIGVIIQQLKIPIGEVLASPYCRTLETAQLAFGQAISTPYLLANFYDPLTARDRLETLVQQLGQRPAQANTNTVLVGHGVNLDSALEILLQEGDAAIFRPIGQGRFDLVRIVKVADWAEIAGSL